MAVHGTTAMPPLAEDLGAAGPIIIDHTCTDLSQVPDYWIEAVANGTFRDPGLRMERVMGVLTQTYGTELAHRATAARPVIIDLVLLCGPTQPGGCRLLAPQQSASAGETGSG